MTVCLVFICSLGVSLSKMVLSSKLALKTLKYIENTALQSL